MGKLFRIILTVSALASCGCGKEEAVASSEPEASKGNDPYWFLGGLALDQETYSESWEDLPIQSIKYFHGGGYPESSPRYHAWLFSGGKAEYKGVEAVDQIGMYTGQVYLFDFARLCQLAETLDIGGKLKSYEPLSSHGTMTQLEITMKSGEKYLLSDWDYQAGIEVWAFSAAVEKVITGIGWKKK